MPFMMPISARIDTSKRTRHRGRGSGPRAARKTLVSLRKGFRRESGPNMGLGPASGGGGMVTEGDRTPNDSPASSGRPIRRFVHRHRGVVALLGVLAVAAVVFVLVWFQPQKYFLNTTVNEAAPRGIVATGTTPPGTGEAAV